jgi:homoserine kinase
MRTEATAFAPASVSNVACGFDIMGFAVEGAGDRVTVRRVPGREVRIVSLTGCACELPLEVVLNTAGPPVLEVARRSGYEGGLEILIQKALPIGSGIGSSAASAVAAAVAANAVLEAGLSRAALLECAIAGEQVASGAVHADNLAPSLWGGFTLVRGTSPVDVVPILCPCPLWCGLLLPSMSITTKQSRQLLPGSIPLADVVIQTANAAGLVAGLLQGDPGLISRSLHDRIAEPVRRKTIPAYDSVKQAALDAGALGCNISGSGPAVFALCHSAETARRAVEAMSHVFSATGLGSSTIISNIDTTGARIVE